MANEIVTEIRLDLDKMRADLKQAVDDAKDAGEKSGKSMGSGIEGGITSALGGIKAVFAGAAAAIGAAFTLKESIHAAMEQESAINALNSAMALTGTYSDAAAAHFNDLASSLQTTTVYADDMIQRGGALLVTMGKLSGDGLDRATKASLDMASALGIDASQAFTLVAKAATGHTESLKRYGIQVSKTGDDTTDFNRALTALESKFKGFAELQSNTFAGALTKTKNQFGEILESIGNLIIKSPLIIVLMDRLAKAFAIVADSITKWAEGRDVISELADVLIEVGHNLVTYIVAPLELVYNTGVLVFNGLKTLIQGFIVSIAEGASAITSVLAALSPERFGELNASVQAFAESSGAVLNDFATQTGESMDQIFNFDAAAQAEKYLGQVQEFVDNVQEPTKAKLAEMGKSVAEVSWAQQFADSFMGAAKSIANSTEAMGQKFAELGTKIYATIGTGVTNSFAAMGAAMAKGENGFAAFGKAMIGVLGDIAIQAGSTFIGIGVAKAIASVGSDPTAYALIAAGGALAVLGGALKAYAGGGGGASAPAISESGGGVAAGGGGGTSAPATAATTFNNEQERKDVGQAVTVNVQGNVFDRRETGMHIADVINETFGSNGITFATGAT